LKFKKSLSFFHFSTPLFLKLPAPRKELFILVSG